MSGGFNQPAADGFNFLSLHFRRKETHFEPDHEIVSQHRQLEDQVVGPEPLGQHPAPSDLVLAHIDQVFAGGALVVKAFQLIGRKG